MNDLDPIRNALDVLKLRSAGRMNPNPELEENLMSVHDQQVASRSRNFKIVLIALAGLLATGVVAEAATGALSSLIYRVALDTGSGPQPVTDYDAKDNGDGSVTVTVALPEGQQSGVVTVETKGK